MSILQSKHDKQASGNDELSPASHILELLADLNSKGAKTADDNDDCTSLHRRVVNTKRLHRSLKKYEDTPIFKEYQIAEMIKSLAPLSVTMRLNEKDTNSDLSIAYYDVYGAEPRGSKHKEITAIIAQHVGGNSDIANVVLEYRGNEIFLFTTKRVTDGHQGKTWCN